MIQSCLAWRRNICVYVHGVKKNESARATKSHAELLGLLHLLRCADFELKKEHDSDGRFQPSKNGL
jgi:hypothetical protein